MEHQFSGCDVLILVNDGISMLQHLRLTAVPVFEAITLFAQRPVVLLSTTALS
jgi:hypothetical protein